MALEDLAIFRAVPNTVVLYPSDGISAERATELAANHRGSVYIRTSRPDTAIIYDENTPFAIG
jgi:transketolase